MSAHELRHLKITTLQAQQLVQHALEEGSNACLAISAAVVDASGHILAFLRNDDAFLGSIDASVSKARTAVYFRRATAAMQQGLEQGKMSYLVLPGALPLEGGVPLYLNERVVGALGISGATSAQDGDLARAAVVELGFAGRGI